MARRAVPPGAAASLDFYSLGMRMIDHRQAERYAELLSALSEAHRIQVIECLRSGSRHVTELARLLNAEIVNVSHHLGILRAAKVVVTEKKGRYVIYSLNPEYFKSQSDKSMTMDIGWCRVEFPHN